MLRFAITDPYARENPVGELQTKNRLIYHGTHSMFSPSIEQHGFCFECFDTTYRTQVLTIVDACDKFDLHPDGHDTAKGFSEKNWVYFSVSFLSARGYALNVGCERIDGALRAAKTLFAFVEDKNKLQSKVAFLDTVLNQNGHHPATERVLANLRNSDLVRQLADRVQKARFALDLATSQGYPVVYAVHADQDWIRGNATSTSDWERETFGGIGLPRVSADRIVVRVEYPNGISPDSE